MPAKKAAGVSKAASKPVPKDVDLDADPDEGDESVTLEDDQPEVAEPTPEPEVEPEYGPPAPIHPSSTPGEIRRRTNYERQINSDAEAFANEARATYIAAKTADPEAVVLIQAKYDSEGD